MKFRILSYNIHKGMDWRGKALTIEKIKESIEDLGPDLVFLQEIVGKDKKREEQFSNWPDSSQYEFLADKIWPHYAYGKNAVYEKGHHGNAILSKFPIQTWNRQDISTNRFERRGILYCTIELPPEIIGANKSVPLHAYCLHLDLLHRGRKKQYEMIYNRLDQDLHTDEPVIVAGDFNDWNKGGVDIFEKDLEMKEAYKYLNGNYAKTFPSKLPVLSLDRIYTKNIIIRDVEVLNTGFWRENSDHAALLATVEILPAT